MTFLQELQHNQPLMPEHAAYPKLSIPQQMEHDLGHVALLIFVIQMLAYY